MALVARYCCYCGELQTLRDVCEGCKRPVVRPPPDESDLDTLPDGEGNDEDDEDVDQDEEDGERGREEDVLAPPEHQEMLYGYVDRVRGLHVHTFHFHRESDGSFILAASMAANGEGAIYLHRKQNLNRHDTRLSDVPTRMGQPGFVACLIPASILGTEFLIANSHRWWSNPLNGGVARIGGRGRQEEDGVSLKRSASSSSNSNANAPPQDDREAQYAQGSAILKELGLVVFDANILGTQPNTIKATVRANPESLAAGSSIRARLGRASKTRVASDQSLFDRLRGRNEKAYMVLGQTEEEDEIATFETKKPTWSDSVGGWTLDFNGRVTISSKKNFLLVPCQRDELMFGSDTIGVRFGKVAKHRFNLDYRFPFSPVTAFAIAMSMFSAKMYVTVAEPPVTMLHGHSRHGHVVHTRFHPRAVAW